MLSTCTKDYESLTDGEKNAQKLKKIIDSKNITSFNVFEYLTYAYQYEDWIFITSGNNSEIEIVGS
jgi:hypothetical protein